jgi:hypothetical protein
VGQFSVTTEELIEKKRDSEQEDYQLRSVARNEIAGNSTLPSRPTHCESELSTLGDALTELKTSRQNKDGQPRAAYPQLNDFQGQLNMINAYPYHEGQRHQSLHVNPNYHNWNSTERMRQSSAMQLAPKLPPPSGGGRGLKPRKHGEPKTNIKGRSSDDRVASISGPSGFVSGDVRNTTGRVPSHGSFHHGQPPQMRCNNMSSEKHVYVHCECNCCKERNLSVHVTVYQGPCLQDTMDVQARIKFGFSNRFGFVEAVMPTKSGLTFLAR